jgi:hypothetical protein
MKSVQIAAAAAAAAAAGQRRHTEGPVVVGNPTRDLHFADVEAVEVGKRLLVAPLLKDEATRPAVLNRIKGSSHIHLTCHSSWEQKSFFMSAAGSQGKEEEADMASFGGPPHCAAVTCDNCGDEDVYGTWHRCETCLYRMDGVRGYTNPIPPSLRDMPTLCGRCFEEKGAFHEKGHDWISVQPVTMTDIARLGPLKVRS